MPDLPAAPDGLLVDIDGPVLRLTLNRPERRNAVTDEIVASLTAIIEAAETDDEVRVVSLVAAGEHFCSGFDLGGRGASADRPRAGATQRRMRTSVNRLIPTMLEAQTPIVAACRGWVAGLGLHIALASDFVVVADDARLWEPFADLGFTPDSGGTWLLPRLVGVARAKRMLMLAEEVGGVDAAAWGLVHAAVPSSEVDDVAHGLVERLASAATVTVGLTKRLVQSGLTSTLADHLADEALALEVSTRSEDFAEAMKARREKRPPGFTGR